MKSHPTSANELLSQVRRTRARKVWEFVVSFLVKGFDCLLYKGRLELVRERLRFVEEGTPASESEKNAPSVSFLTTDIM